MSLRQPASLLTRSRHSRPGTHRGDRRTRPGLERLEDRMAPAAGVLDPAFGSAGLHLTDVTATVSAAPVDVAVLPGGGTLVLAAVGPQGYGQKFALARLQSDGTLDPSFGADGPGLTLIDGGPYVTSKLRRLVPQGDKVLVVGEVSPDPATAPDFGVFRFTAAGQPDPSFGTGGRVLIDFSSGGLMSVDSAYDAVLAGDKVLVVGDAGSGAAFAVARLDAATGALDTGFDGDGKVTVGVPGNALHGAGVAVLAGGQVVIAGNTWHTGLPYMPDYSRGSVALARLGADGAVDTTFGTGGVFLDAVGSPVSVVGVVPRGDGVAVAGDIGSMLSVQNYFAAGYAATPAPATPTQTSFSSGFGPAPAQAAVLRLQSDGNLLVGGLAGGQFAAARYTPDLILAASATVTLPAAYGTPSTGGAVAVADPAGPLVWAGAGVTFGSQGPVPYGLIARANFAGVLDPTFDGDGVAVVQVVSSLDNAAEGLAVPADGRVVSVGVEGSDLVVRRLKTDGTPDPAFGTGGRVALTPPAGSSFSAPGKVVVQPADGKTVAAAVTGGQVRVTRLLAGDGGLDPGFGDQGVSVLTWPGGVQAGSLIGLALTAAGQVVVAATPAGYAPTQVLVARLDATGSPDPGFGGGAVVADLGTAVTLNALAVSAGDRVVLGGGTPYSTSGPGQWVLARLDTGGALDTTFGTAGVVVLPRGGSVQALAPDGTGLFIGGQGYPDGPAVARIKDGGNLDGAFGNGGWVPVAGASAVTALARQGDGRVLLAAPAYATGPQGSTPALLTARLNADGTPDPWWGRDDSGRALTLLPAGSVMAMPTVAGIAAGPGGTVLVAGGSGPSQGRDAFVARFLDPPPQPRIQFSDPFAVGTEQEGHVTVTVRRSVITAGAVSVHYEVLDGTAKAGADFAAAAGDLAFADGQSTATFTVTIPTDPAAEPLKTATLHLSAPVGAELGQYADVPLYVKDGPVMTVTSPADSGPGTLRQALEDANAYPDPDTITFAAGLSGTLTLAAALPALTTPVTLRGPGAGVLTVARDAAGTAAFPILAVSSGGRVTVSGLTLTGGTQGGVTNGGTLTLDAVTVRGNTGGSGFGPYGAPGGIYNSGTLTVLNSTVADNSNQDCMVAAGIDSEGGSVTIVNSTISHNVGTNCNSAGGIGIYGGTLVLKHCTVTLNEANNSNASGGGVDAFGSSATILDSIIAGNTGAQNNGGDVAGTFTSLGYNLIGKNNPDHAVGGTGFAPSDLVGNPAAPIDPLLGPLGDNGGPTPTHLPALTSPAVDAGDATGAPATDQRGYQRVYGQGIDIGAAELGSPVSPVTSLGLSAPTAVTAGAAFTVTATVRTGAAPDLTYAGTVTLQVGTTVLGQHTFTASDNGSYAFTVTLTAAGPVTLTAADAGTLTASAGLTVTPGPASTLVLTSASWLTGAGASNDYAVTVMDSSGNVVTGYTGTVILTSSDPQAPVLGEHTFAAADAGHFTFRAALKTAGPSVQVTAADKAQPSLQASTSMEVIAGTASSFSIAGPASVTVGEGFAVTLTAMDPYGNVVTGYAGSVTLTSTDPAATLPTAPLAFAAADKGTRAVTGLTLQTPGTVSLTATDTATPAVAGSLTTVVKSPYTGTDLQLENVYQALFGRDLDPAGQDYWTGRLAAGATWEQVLHEISASPEGRQAAVRDVYGALLGRAPDPDGLAFWAAWLAEPGHTPEGLRLQVLASDEFFLTHGGTAAGLLGGWYAALFGRDVDPSGRASWGDRLEAGHLAPAARQDVVQGLLDSAEYARARVEQVYHDLLGRDPDPAGWDYWAGRLQGPETPEDVLFAVAASEEFLGHSL